MASSTIVHGKGDNKVVKWSERDPQKIRHKVPGQDPRPVIDYTNLDIINNHEGLKGRAITESTEDGHHFFMENYQRMFANNKPLPSIPIGRRDQPMKSISNEATGSATAVPSSTNRLSDIVSPETLSHDVADHMAKLHKERKIVDPVIIAAKRIKELRTLLKKLPYERTAEDNDIIYTHLKEFPLLSEQLSNKELKELCTTAHMDIWKDEDYTVFGNNGFHIILRGSVVPQTEPWLRTRGHPGEFRSPTPILTTTVHTDKDVTELTVGDCFGTLERLEGKEPNSKVLTVLTKSVPCEFLKISSNDFKRITEQIRERHISEKINLIQACKRYQLWPRQSLHKLAELIRWTKFPENTVLVSEGYLCPFIAFIKSGDCHVLRQVDVLQKMPNGSQEKRLKQVVMGRLQEAESFGEISVLDAEAITCSIVTASDIKLGIITPERLQDLEETTKALLRQSNERLYGNLTRDDIHNEYIDQELKREWNQFKHGVVVDVINTKGIRPGYGKWSTK
ncbi:cyclic nucleotide-binding domain-containing protein 1-like [Asterias rubens]|uniref:cyclic nucleotide-binding domain-containing protein 1-like n=1 Tax=Asterias rubens TaxID=7604 RepID=UPI0014555935|nr:cyclic nucleotide-binding domain-containing protein 1-like [Asterias rubens]